MRSGGERGAVFQYSYPLHFHQRWVSELATACCPKHILWWRLRASLIYGSREENRKGSVMLYPLSRMILGDSSRLTPKASTCHFRFLFLSLVCVSVSKAKCLTTWKKNMFPFCLISNIFENITWNSLPGGPCGRKHQTILTYHIMLVAIFYHLYWNIKDSLLIKLFTSLLKYKCFNHFYIRRAPQETVL